MSHVLRVFCLPDSDCEPCKDLKALYRQHGIDHERIGIHTGVGARAFERLMGPRSSEIGVPFVVALVADSWWEVPDYMDAGAVARVIKSATCSTVTRTCSLNPAKARALGLRPIDVDLILSECDADDGDEDTHDHADSARTVSSTHGASSAEGSAHYGHARPPHEHPVHLWAWFLFNMSNDMLKGVLRAAGERVSGNSRTLIERVFALRCEGRVSGCDVVRVLPRQLLDARAADLNIPNHCYVVQLRDRIAAVLDGSERHPRSVEICWSGQNHRTSPCHVVT